LKTQIVSLQRRTDSLTNALKATNTSIGNLDKKVDSLRTQITLVLTQINSLNAQLSTANVNIADLQAKIAELQKKCEELTKLLNDYLSSLSAKSISDGLIGYWPFNGNANDESGNSDGVVNGPTLTTDRFGSANSAYNFDGINDFIRVLDNSTLRPEKISLVAWVKTSSRLGIILGKTNFANANNEQYALSLDSRKAPLEVLFGIKQNSNCLPSSGWRNSGTINSISDNKWHFIVGTFDGTSLKLYIDGALVNTNNSLPTNKIDGCVGGNIEIGRWWSSDPLYFRGIIDDLRIYNRALSQNEIQYLYAN
jgi:hypothetical protein